jgi:hypothetical protein
MNFEILLWALGFMVATFLIGGAAYAIYHWVLEHRR